MHDPIALLVLLGTVGIVAALAFGAWPLRQSTTTRRSLPDVTGISLRARQAIALRLFEGYCARAGLHHAEIERFLEWWWEFVLFFGDGDWFGRWEKPEPVLERVAYGAPCPTDISQVLVHAGVRQAEFLKVLSCTSEVASGSFYAAAEEKGSRRALYELADIVTDHGVTFPSLIVFTDSRWEGDGWGLPPTEEELALWRAA